MTVLMMKDMIIPDSMEQTVPRQTHPLRKHKDLYIRIAQVTVSTTRRDVVFSEVVQRVQVLQTEENKGQRSMRLEMRSNFWMTSLRQLDRIAT